MLAFSLIDAKGVNDNGTHYMEYLLATEKLSAAIAKDAGEAASMAAYYGQGGGDSVFYSGKGAAALGLIDKEVVQEDLMMLAQGFAPDGTALCRNAGAKAREVIKLDRNGNPRLDKKGQPVVKLEGGHRVGQDFVWTPDKAYSLAFALADDDEKLRILDALKEANQVGMDWLESKAETRRGAGGRDVLGVRGIVSVQAVHVGNRSNEPNIHIHNVWFGVAIGDDGKWSTFENRELLRHRKAADAIISNEFALRMRGLGYGVRTERKLDDNGNDTGLVKHRIHGISDELCEHFSSRSAQLREYMKKHGVDEQTACLATRQRKEEPPYDDLVKQWKDDFANCGLEVPTMKELKNGVDGFMEAAGPNEILEHLHRSEALFTEPELIERLAREHTGHLNLGELLEKVEEFKAHTGIITARPQELHIDDQGRSLSRRHTEDRYAASWMVDWEREVVHRVASRVDEDHQKVSADKVEQAIHDYEQRKGFTLSDEQRQAVEHLTMGTGGVGVLQGLAGTGKTTVSDCYSAAFQAQGRTMRGVCVSNAAAEKLEQESGMSCQSVALFLSRLDREKDKLTRHDVIVVDEAGMLDTNQTRRILAHAHLAGAKVVLQGDTQQLQPIGAGSGMSLARAAVGSAKLTEIRRQARVEDRETAGLYYPRDEQGQIMDLSSATPRSQSQMLDHGRAVLGALDRAGAIDEFTTKNQAMEGLVHDYLEHAAPVNDKLVLAHARHEVSALNLAIRDGLKTRGLISPRESTIQAKENGRTQDLPIANGDRVRFTSRIKELGVVNGTRAVVLANRPNAEGGVDLKVRIQSDNPKHDGRVLTFNSNEHNQLAHDYASTVHKAQGQGKKEVFHLANLSMLDNQSALVAFTRLTGGNYSLYATEEEAERLAERFGMDRLKGNVLEAGLKDQGHALTGNDTGWFESQAQQFAAKLRARQGQSTRPQRLEHKASL